MSDDGAKIAHSIRRSAALYMAVITSSEGTPDKVLFERADTYAKWIRGSAGPSEDDDYIGFNPWPDGAE